MIKYVLATLVLLMIPLSTGDFSHKEELGAEYTVLHINAKWNQANNVNLDVIPNCRLQYAFLEDQPKEIQQGIQYVPHVILLKHNRPIAQWSADLSFKLNITTQEIVRVIDGQ
jgi:hypothetical protein